MKIKVALLDEDQYYVRRITNAFANMFGGEVEIYSFTEKETAVASIDTGNTKVDLLLASEGFDIDVSKLPKSCGFAYFVESPDVNNLRGEKTICKFQKAELIYKQMLALYSDCAEVEVGVTVPDGDEAVVLAFVSASGGTGSSTTAAACAKMLAKKDFRVLYLNLEKFGSSGDFFKGGGTFDLSDIIFAIKSNKNNLTIKLESMVKHDVSGVFFFDSCRMAFDVMEINPNDMNRLLYELKHLGKYDYIVIDMDFTFEKREVEVMKHCYRMVFVSNGTEIATTKLKKALEALAIFEQQNKISVMPKVNLLYNMFRKDSGYTIQVENIKDIGGIPRIASTDVSQIIDYISTRDVFDSFIINR